MAARILSILGLIALSFVHARAQESAPDLSAARTAIERLAKTMETVKRIRAHYVQYQESLLLAEPLVSKGTLHLRADPGCLLLELTEPRQVIVRSDPKSHQMYWPTEKLAERWLFRSNDLARALLRCFSADIRAIESTFEIRGFLAGEKTSEIELVPRDEKLRRYLAALTLTLANDTGNLVGIAHRNAEGERVRFELSEIDLAPDPTPEDALFDRSLAADVRLLVHEVAERQ